LINTLHIPTLLDTSFILCPSELSVLLPLFSELPLFKDGLTMTRQLLANFRLADLRMLWAKVCGEPVPNNGGRLTKAKVIQALRELARQRPQPEVQAEEVPRAAIASATPATAPGVPSVASADSALAPAAPASSLAAPAIAQRFLLVLLPGSLR
jgi:hypothetical protein